MSDTKVPILTTTHATMPDQVVVHHGDPDPWMRCPHWCVEIGQHGIQDPLDRTHFGPGVQIPLELLPLERDELDDDAWQLPYVSLYLRQGNRDAEPEVWLGKSESSEGFCLTLAEARALGERLLDLVYTGEVKS